MMDSEDYSVVYNDMFDNNLWKSYRIIKGKYYFNDIGTESPTAQIEIMSEMEDNE